MRQNLRRWMLDYAVLHKLPPELARQAADPDMIKRDTALCILKEPGGESDEAVFSALCAFSGKNRKESSVIAIDPERGKRLFSEAWRTALSYCLQGKDLFTLCFGVQKTRVWQPLFNAVYAGQRKVRSDRISSPERTYQFAQRFRRGRRIDEIGRAHV